MRPLNSTEMMAIRVSLSLELVQLEGLFKTATVLSSRCGYVRRINIVTKLLDDLAPGATVTVARPNEEVFQRFREVAR